MFFDDLCFVEFVDDFRSVSIITETSCVDAMGNRHCAVVSTEFGLEQFSSCGRRHVALLIAVLSRGSSIR